MDIDSRRTLRRIQGNDDTLTKLCVGNAYGEKIVMISVLFGAVVFTTIFQTRQCYQK